MNTSSPFSLSEDSCIALAPSQKKKLTTLQPRVQRSPNESVTDVFRQMDIASNHAAVCNQRGGLLLLNDGTEAPTDVWQRLSLTSSKPLDCFSGEDLTDFLLSIPEARVALQRATLFIAPLSAGPRVVQGIASKQEGLVHGKRVLTPAPSRVIADAEDRKATVTISSDDVEMMRSAVDHNLHVVIIDDVSSSYQTASQLARVLRDQGARSVSLLTLVGILPKEAQRNFISDSGLDAFYAGVITGYQGGDAWKTPAIASTGGLFETTRKGALRRENIARYLPDNGIGLQVLQQRLSNEFRLLLWDLDGTYLEKGEPQPELRSVLLDKESHIFNVAATGRSHQSFHALSDDTRRPFQAAIVDGGMRVVVNGNTTRIQAPQPNNQEIETLIKRASRSANAFARITQTGNGQDFPIWVRVRTQQDQLDQADEWNAADTVAATVFAEQLSNHQRLEAIASGYGDVLIVPRGVDKGLTGIDELAARIPTLPSLETAIAIGDGPNDIQMLKRITQQRGTSIAVNPVNDTVASSATHVMDHSSLARYLRGILD